MCTASVLCIGMSGDTIPNSAGSRPAFGSPPFCAATGRCAPSISHAPAHAAAMADAKMRFLMFHSSFLESCARMTLLSVPATTHRQRVCRVTLGGKIEE